MTASVLIMTYNHERFIEQAVESALMQVTDFEYEILISEDCSTDRTREIVETLAARHPGRIRLILSERNLRSNEVVARGVRGARGTYVAMLDGDDYWTAHDKLQRQVDFLDGHPECAICFHNVNVLDDNGAVRRWTPDNHPPVSSLDDLWGGNFIATCSTMFRTGLFGEFPEWYASFFPITDWPLHILNAEHGDIGYLDEVKAVYRLHDGGLYSPFSESQKLEETFSFYQRINECLGYRYDRAIRQALFRYFLEWAEEYLRRGDGERARFALALCRSGRPQYLRSGLKRAARVWVRSWLSRPFPET